MWQIKKPWPCTDSSFLQSFLSFNLEKNATLDYVFTFALLHSYTLKIGTHFPIRRTLHNVSISQKSLSPVCNKTLKLIAREFQSCQLQHLSFSTSWWGCDQMWSPGSNYVYCFIFNALIFVLCRHIRVKSINIIWHNMTYKLVCVSLAVLFSSKGHINWTVRVQCKPRRKSIMRHHLNIKISHRNYKGPSNEFIRILHNNTL